MARNKRNEFVHECFRFKDGEINKIVDDTEKMHLDANALKKVEEWIKAYDKAIPVVIKLMLLARKSTPK